MKKTLIGICLVLCLALPVFANGNKEAAQVSDAPVVIELWYAPMVSEAGQPPADWEVLDLIRERVGVDLRLTALPSNENDQDVKVQAAAAANNLPDLFAVRRPPLMNLIKQGLVHPVDELYDMMPNRTPKMYEPATRSFAVYNGKNYGLASTIIQRNEGVLIRKDWLDKLGLDIPVTTEDFMNVMKAFTFNDPDGNGRNDTWGYGAFVEINNYEEGLGRRFDPWFGAFGVAGTWNLTKADAGLNVRKPAYYEALSFVKGMMDAGVIDPNWMAYKKDDFRAAWKQGKFGIMREQNGAYAAESNYAPFDKNFPDGEWLVIEPPMGPEGHRSVGVYTASPHRALAISAKAANAGKLDAIARLLEWMVTDEGYYLLGWGEENVNYVLDADGVPTGEGVPNPDLAFTKPEIQPITQLRSLVFYQTDAELASRYPSYKTASGKTMSALTALRQMQATTWTPNIGGDTLPLPSPDLKRFYEQGVIEFLTGRRVLNPENWKQFVADFDKLGGLAWETEGIRIAQESGYLQ